MKLEFTFFRQILLFAFLAAIAYCTTAIYFMKQMAYEDSYILYIGNFLFAAVIGIFVAWFYKKHERNIGTIKLVVIGAKTAVAGIITTCILVFLLMLIVTPQVFRPAALHQIQLRASPAQFEGKNQGFATILFLNAILGNAAASFFISLLIPFSVMKNIYPDEKRKNSPTVKEENPKQNYHL